MGKPEHIDILIQGADVWNEWRQRHLLIEPDLRGDLLSNTNLSNYNLSGTDLNGAILRDADLSNANLRFANLTQADFSFADLNGANLTRADLTRANLSNANLTRADLSNANLSSSDLFRADFSYANLSSADLSSANLTKANLSGADLGNADLSSAVLVETNLSKAILTQCSIYGISAWNIELEGATQANLVITKPSEPTITVDSLKIAQFIYLLLNNAEIRDVIDTITSKVVLILGRFTPERKAILDALHDELRTRNYSPVLFDFEKPVSRDLTGTVSTLAHLARFIIVDLTDPSSAPHEVATVIPQTVVPVQPLLLREPLIIDGKAVERREYAMFEDLRRRYHWVLPTFCYQDTAELLTSLQAHIIAPAEQKVRELTQPK